MKRSRLENEAQSQGYFNRGGAGGVSIRAILEIEPEPRIPDLPLFSSPTCIVSWGLPASSPFPQ